MTKLAAYTFIAKRFAGEIFWFDKPIYKSTRQRESLTRNEECFKMLLGNYIDYIFSSFAVHDNN